MPQKAVAEVAKGVGLKSVASGIESADKSITKVTTDASKVLGQTIVAGADAVTGHEKEAGQAITNAGKAVKDTAVDAVKAPTDIAATAANTVGLKSVGKAFNTISDTTGGVVSKAADAAGDTLEAGADLVQGKVSAAGDDMKSAANNVAQTAEGASALGMRVAGAVAGGLGLKSVENEVRF